MRTRYIKPGYFTNEDLGSCDPLAQILFAGLWCLADRIGVLKDRPLRIKAAVFPYRDADVDALLDLLAAMTSHDATPLVIRYHASGEPAIFLPGFAKHQHPFPTERLCGIAPPTEHRVQLVDTVFTLPNKLGLISTQCELNQQHQHDSLAAAAENSTAAEPDAAKAAVEPPCSTRRSSPVLPLDADCEALRESLVESGLSSALANKAVRTADPALIREALRYHAANRTTFRNPCGALRTMIFKPAEWGFELTDLGWKGPAPPKVGKAEVTTRLVETIEETRKRREQQAAEPAAHPDEVRAKLAKARKAMG